MSEIQVSGLRKLRGRIPVQGSKNGVLPMMAASVLSDETIVITNVPAIQDVFCMMGILKFMGCGCRLEGGELVVSPAGLCRTDLPQEAGQMRSSVILLGALLGRCGEAAACYPGGCSIGERPIDFHLGAFRALGAEAKEEGGCVLVRGEPVGGVIRFPYPSVGATENALLAAVKGKGETVILGAAREPEIRELCLFLQAMGADVEGGGTDVIRVQGKRYLHGCRFRAAGDRIVAGTYLMAAMAAEGKLLLEGVKPGHLREVLRVLERAGASISTGEESIALEMNGRPAPLWVETRPYPGFPTDLQSPLMALLCRGEGVSRIRETVFERRYETAGELNKLGASIRVRGDTALIDGKPRLKGGRAAARDLRGGAALVVAGLESPAETVISDCFHIERGYEDICRDLAAAGADIRWLEREAKEKRA